MAVIEITEANFENEVLKSDKPVLLDFWASWCGPCKMLSPLVDKLAESTDKIKVGKVNVDEQEGLATKYSIMSIPTLMLFKDGNLDKQNVGLIPEDKLREFVGL
ncbi:MAG: thioredoxin [Treponemataceae bacterium]|nr:thioredoxin [Treponemataceae bacterium]